MTRLASLAFRAGAGIMLVAWLLMGGALLASGQELSPEAIKLRDAAANELLSTPVPGGPPVVEGTAIAVLASLAASPAALPACAAAEPSSGLCHLALSQLADTELAAVSGWGVRRGAPAPDVAVIIWDEAPQGGRGVVSHNSATGLGATQLSTVTINGR